MRFYNNYLADDEIDLGDIIKVLWREKILILSISIICGLLGYLYASFKPAEFKIEIKYSIINDNLLLEEKPSMFIKNDLLPDKIYYLVGTKWNLKELRDIIKDMYAPDMNPTMDSVMNIIKTITKNISPSTWRDDNINKIIE